MVVNIAYPFAVLYKRIGVDEGDSEACTMSSEVEEQAGPCQFAGGGTACKAGTFGSGIAWGCTDLSGRRVFGKR